MKYIQSCFAKFHRPMECLRSIESILKLSKKNMAKLFGVKVHTYVNWITGTSRVDKNSLKNIIELMEVCDRIMNGEITFRIEDNE